ncbi:Ribosome-inactivating protein [Heracleum sosnowskyi]|uniref:Ribosome-inactivating protein n=1 Tax=Heracleum sosnowskyi TaxID=360622 RepID=A0AAD8HQH3_9APIA|nr:Ribosome-inactivating protein [Heracleum sosnowskyi]
MAKMLWAVLQVGLVAAWLMMNGMSSLSTEDALTVAKNLYAPDPPPYPVVSFNTLSTNPRQTYLDLISRIRRLLTDDTLDPVFGIPRLVNRDSAVPNTRRFLLVELINSNQDTITVAIDTTRLYVVGYRRTNEATDTYEFRYFSDAEDVDTLFPDLEHIVLPFGGSYGALAQAGGSRSRTPLGLASLEQAIMDLEADNKPDLARALTVIIQMISEAIRFRYIEHFVGNLIRRQVVQVPDQTTLDLENEWGTLSDRIQHSVDGTLDPPVLLTNREGIRNSISTVTRGLALQIGILFFVCNRSPNTNQLSLISTGGGTNCTNITEPIIRLPIEKGSAQMEAAGDTCKNIGEPTIRIVGRNGLCADVRDGFYIDGNSIILWPCKSNEDVNQLWTLKAEGTIRSNGKCLTTRGGQTGGYGRLNRN